MKNFFKENTAYIIIGILLVFFTSLAIYFSNEYEEEEKIKISKVRNELVNSSIDRYELFNRAFKFGYELGKTKQAMTSSIATGNTIPLLYRSTVQPNMD